MQSNSRKLKKKASFLKSKTQAKKSCKRSSGVINLTMRETCLISVVSSSEGSAIEDNFVLIDIKFQRVC